MSREDDAAIVEVMADAMFDVYPGYNAETRRNMKMMAQWSLTSQGHRALKAPRAAGFTITLTAEIAQLTERLATAEAALKPFVFGDATLETILWGKFPDDTPGTITVKVGDFRRARAALQHDTADGGAGC